MVCILSFLPVSFLLVKLMYIFQIYMEKIMESPVTSQDSNNSAPDPLNSQSTTVDSGYRLFFIRVNLFFPSTLTYLINVEDIINVEAGKIIKIENRNTINKHKWWLMFKFSELLLLENQFSKWIMKIPWLERFLIGKT